ERTGLRPRRRINRRRGHHAESLEGADPVYGAESARAWVPRAERILRLGPGLRRDESLRALLCGIGEDGEEVGSGQTVLLARRTRTIRMCSFDARSEGQSGHSLPRERCTEHFLLGLLLFSILLTFYQQFCSR